METKEIEIDKTHGSPWDRGSADSYYGRSRKPHKWLDSCGCNRVELTDQKEIIEYLLGYEYNEECGDKKDWN